MPYSVIKKLYFCPRKTNWCWLKTNNYKTDNIDEVTALRHWKKGQPVILDKRELTRRALLVRFSAKESLLTNCCKLAALRRQISEGRIAEGAAMVRAGGRVGVSMEERRKRHKDRARKECIRVHVGTFCWKLNFTSSAWNHVRGNPEHVLWVRVD